MRQVTRLTKTASTRSGNSPRRPQEGERLARGAHAHEDFPDRDDENWMQHSLQWVDEQGKVELGYRPVHMYTLTDDVEVVPPKARVY